VSKINPLTVTKLESLQRSRKRYLAGPAGPAKDLLQLEAAHNFCCGQHQNFLKYPNIK